jgi:ApbE superfamily uncharacterized protein (UPF0280 family)
MNAWGEAPQRMRLADGRWHFRHGPIDLVIAAESNPAEPMLAADRVGPSPHRQVLAALDAAWARFVPLLGALAAELPALRADAREPAVVVRGAVAARMLAATRAIGACFDLFVTPMAAVAGAVAEHIAECFERPGIHRASVNNGGDIALVLAPGAYWDVGVVADPARPEVGARLHIAATDRLRGVATSGWHGRSLSLGIADSVTVLADDAPAADAAATLIANHVDLPGHDGIVRLPAERVRDGSDLGARLATVAVPSLSAAEIDAALDRGVAFAARVIEAGLARQALLTLQGCTRAVSACATASDGGRPFCGPAVAIGDVARVRILDQTPARGHAMPQDPS